LGPAKKALELYHRAADKVRAAQLAGQACLAVGNETEAMKYFEIVSELRPKNYDNLKSLLGLSLRHKEMDKAAATAKTMLGGEPKSRDILADIHAAYTGAKASHEFREFLERMKGQYGKDEEVLGNLYLYQAKMESEAQKKGDALESLKRAREYYTKVLKPTAKGAFEVKRLVLNAVLLSVLMSFQTANADDNSKPLPMKENKPIPLKQTGKSFRLYKSNQVKPLATPLNPLPKPGAKKPGKSKEKL
jgi:tetratricopeptide (TPR) repeat protein